MAELKRPDMNVGENIYVVLINEDGTREVHECHNIVTDAGDIYYAQRAASEAPTNAFDIFELGTAGNAPAKNSDRSDLTSPVGVSQKVFDVGYPQTNDPDVDNPGTVSTDTVSYRVTYTTAEANAVNIDRLVITNATPGGSEPLLSYATFGAPFSKTGSQTLKVFLNHTFGGI